MPVGGKRQQNFEEVIRNEEMVEEVIGIGVDPNSGCWDGSNHPADCGS